MSEIVVNYSNIDSIIARLGALKQRVEVYSKKENRMEESKGAAKDSLVEVSNAFATVALRLEEYIDKTIDNVNHIKITFKEADEELSSQLH